MTPNKSRDTFSPYRITMFQIENLCSNLSTSRWTSPTASSSIQPKDFMPRLCPTGHILRPQRPPARPFQVGRYECIFRPLLLNCPAPRPIAFGRFYWVFLSLFRLSWRLAQVRRLTECASRALRLTLSHHRTARLHTKCRRTPPQSDGLRVIYDPSWERDITIDGIVASVCHDPVAPLPILGYQGCNLGQIKFWGRSRREGVEFCFPSLSSFG